jgi:gamma-glutamyltranspeptidase/glutathione hydrolase
MKIRRSSLGLVALMLSAHSALCASRPAVEAAHAMVVTSQHLASDIGAQILREGGNAVDAAAAVGYAEAVTNPCCGNIGGGGFMVLHMASGADRFINFRETAPAASTPGMFLDKDGEPIKGASLIGWLSVGAPGTVLGLDTALREYGTMPRAKIMAPAIRLAREGYVLNAADVAAFNFGAAKLRFDPAAAAIFLRPDGGPLQAGDRLIQPQLADTLEAIARDGPDAFYKGALPSRIEAAAKAGGGIIAADDFAHYTITETDPLTCSYRGFTLLSAPPPSSGGIALCEILNILEGYDMKALGFHSAAAVHVMVEAMRHAYFDRNTYLGDPAFVTNPIARLTSKDYAARIRTHIPPDSATPSKELRPGVAPHEQNETTHYSIIDSAGNAVSVTYTVNGVFGAGVMAPGAGFLMNDEMDDFTIKAGAANMFGLVQGVVNAIAPGKRPLSSMAPTIVMHDGRVFAVIGSPGGSRIITIILETLLNLIDYGMRPQEAVDAPRIHHQWLPDQVFVEPYALSPDTSRLLEAMGYAIREQSGWGASEVIVLPTDATEAAAPATSGNDSTFGGRTRPGFVYGADDARRPNGSAVGQ